jgi:hypothetical protein
MTETRIVLIRAASLGPIPTTRDDPARIRVSQSVMSHDHVKRWFRWLSFGEETTHAVKRPSLKVVVRPISVALLCGMW